MAKPPVPAEANKHFARANRLHEYVEKSFGEAVQHALKAGEELTAAKATIPHGSWESACERLFDGSLTTARFYMQFYRHVSSLPKQRSTAVLLLESTLDGAAKAAKKAAKPSPPAPTQSGADPDADPFDEPTGGSQETEGGTDSDGSDAQETPSRPPRSGKATPAGTSESQQEAAEGPGTGKCPNCMGTKWEQDDEGYSCAKCHHPWGEPAGDVDAHTKTPRQKEIAEAKAEIKRWMDAVGRWMSGKPGIDAYREQFPGPEGDKVITMAKALFNAMDAWRKGLK